MITKDKLEHGVYYTGNCRNATIARWNTNKEVFYHWRTKFGNRFIETIKHPEDDDIFDVFVPKAIVDFGTEEIPFEEL